MADFLNKYKRVLMKFPLEGRVLKGEPYGNGHINETFLVTTEKKRYIFQVMNKRIFKNPEGLMENIAFVTAHLKEKGIETLNLVYTNKGNSFLSEKENYRIYDFIEHSVTFERATELWQMEEAGKAFGLFEKGLGDVDASRFFTVLPHFHDTLLRFRQLKEAYSLDRFERAALVEKEFQFFQKRASSYNRITEGLEKGTLPLRVTHNDTKLNNVLFDGAHRKFRAVIDLDTVMEGSLLFDFGDAIRFGASSASEDEEDFQKVHFEKPLYDAYLKGFLSKTADFLTKEEEEFLPFSAFLMTAECGMRFLTDFLSGDVYFKTKKEGHNLIRCRNQIALASQMEKTFSLSL